jgi:hypothetical protein
MGIVLIKHDLSRTRVPMILAGVRQCFSTVSRATVALRS